MAKGFVAAMEDDAPEVEIEVTAEVPAEVEREVAEVHSEGDGIVEETEAMEDATEDLEQLEDITDVAEKSVEEGEGLEPVAAEIAEVAVESIYARLGISKNSPMPAMESFGSTNSRKGATNIAIEDWKDTLKRGWEAVVKFFQGIIEKIKTFFFNLLNSNKSLTKAADALLAKVKALSSDHKPTSDTIENSSIAKALGAKDTATKADAEEIIKNHKGIAAGSLIVYGSIEKAIKSMDAVAKKLSAGESEEKATSDIKEAIDGLYKTYSEIMRKTSGYKQSDNKAVAGPFINGKLISLTLDTTSITISIDESEGKAGTKAKVLSQDEMKTLCEEVKSLLVINTELKTKLPVIEASNKAVVDISRTIISGLEKISKAAGSESNETLTELRKAVNNTGGALIKTASALPSMNLMAGKAVLNYVSASLDAYKAESKKKD